MSGSMSSLPRTEKAFGFSSPPPRVRLVHAFERPFENVVATARTCYSAKGIVTEDQASARPERRDALAKSIYAAGHHTTFQHAHFQFALENVSRQFLWSFLHSHPFYNSEQVSQRYVEVQPGNYAVPPLEGEALEVYNRTVSRQIAAYQELCRALVPLVEAEYYERFPARGRRRETYGKEVRKKGQEVARYVLPVATFAYLYHTISGLTLLRYYRMAEQSDAPLEQRLVLEKMVQEMLRQEPGYRVILEEPIPREEMPEFHALPGNGIDTDRARRFVGEFDRELGPRISLLVD